jgi:hypothetical protein
MNDKSSAYSTHTTDQKDGQFHIALAWLAALSASIAALLSLS